MILHWSKLRRFAQNRINPHWKASQNHCRVKESYESYFQEKPPTHIGTSYAIIKIFRTGKESGHLFTSWDSALFNESNYLSGVRKIFAGKKLASRNSAFLCVFEHPTEYPSTFVRECFGFISHCVSRLETLDEKSPPPSEKNPLNFVISPWTQSRLHRKWL